MVIDLAKDLSESGIEVILDKWSLREGQDALVFMEQMVTNQDIKKVAIISDKTYADKADGRAGGVGTETQIISRKVYENQAQEKFVAIVTDKDENGEPFLPTYYKSRIYIDLSDADRYSENFEKLLRWVFDKPLFVKPVIGSKPAFLDDPEQPLMGTAVAFRRCVDALKNSKTYVSGALDEYCSAFVVGVEQFKLSKPDGEFDDAVIKNIEAFLPVRNEVIQVFTAVARYSPIPEHVKRLHRFFEELVPYLSKPPHVTSWNDWDFDNLRFIVHELFLYFLAIFLRHDRLEGAAQFLGTPYYVRANIQYGKDPIMNHQVFDDSLRSLEHRKQRLKLRWYSLRAELLRQRCVGVGLEFQNIMQADFIAFMRAEILAEPESPRWWPETLLYLQHSHSAFEVFARASSVAYFDRAKKLIGVENRSDLEPLLKSYKEGTRLLPRWDFESFSPAALLGSDKLATRP